MAKVREKTKAERLAKKKQEQLVKRLEPEIDKAIMRGFHQATKKQLLEEAKSKTHLRKLIGEYQDGKR